MALHIWTNDKWPNSWFVYPYDAQFNKLEDALNFANIRRKLFPRECECTKEELDSGEYRKRENAASYAAYQEKMKW